MNFAEPNNTFRWVLLRHLGSPNDLIGIHFDLLLEDKKFCRSWRLSQIPLIDGPYVDATYISPHQHYWLDVKEKVVSSNRGVATRIMKGNFFKSLPKIDTRFINLPLVWENTLVDLVIDKQGCRISIKK